MTKDELLKLSNSAINKKIKLTGTDYDRRRRVNNDLISNMNSMVKSGDDLADIAKHYGISTEIVRYHTDSDFKHYKNSQRKKYKQSVKYTTDKERAEYKRALVELGVIV